ncbi:ABC transporter permease [Bifidobacterium gallicum]|nr:ABC transporter, permease protein [Bifidobacterium gallicum DSM 20093 = LMG 11596]
MWAHGTGRFALVVMALWTAIALVSLFWTPVPLGLTDGFNVWAAPSLTHIMGTDGTGADMFSWLIAGMGTDLFIVIVTVALTAALGLLVESLMVSRSVALSQGSIVTVDALISIPTMLIALMLAAPLGATVIGVILACGIGYGLNLARVARPAALLAARSAYVESARANGASAVRVFFTHIVPNCMPVMIVQLSLSAGTALLAEAGLTYLGIGVPSGTPSLGRSIATSVSLITVHPTTVIWPGLTATILVVALNLLGDNLRDAIDPLRNPALRQLGHAVQSSDAAPEREA